MPGSNEFANIFDLLVNRAEEWPETVVFTYLEDGEREGDQLTLGELLRRATSIGAVLRERGLSGERAMLLYPNGLDFIAAFWGCLAAGVVAVPMSLPDMRSRASALARMAAVLQDAAPRVLLANGPIVAMGKHFLSDTAGVSLEWLDTTEIPVEDSHIGGPWPSADGNTLAYLQYTSGSTATPKGVMISHGNVLSSLETISLMLKSTPGEQYVSWLPQFHDMGLMTGALRPVYGRSTAHIMSPLDFLRRPMRWLEAASRLHCRYLASAVFGYDLCVQKSTAEERRALDLSHCISASIGAEPIRKKTIEDFSNAFAVCGFRKETFKPGYGLAEAVLQVSMMPMDAPYLEAVLQSDALARNLAVDATLEETKPVSHVACCGQITPHVRCRIVDPETCAAVDENRIGEVWVQGAVVAQGYWRNAEATEATFGAYRSDAGEGPFLRTGDLGFLRDGALYVTGRVKDLIILHGANFYPQDIELAVKEVHAGLRPGCACAFSVEAAHEERLIVVQEAAKDFVSRTEQHQDAIAGIRRTVAEQCGLPVYSVVLIQPGTLPKTTSGKLQRSMCRSLYLDGELAVVALHLDEPPKPETPPAEKAASPLLERLRAAGPDKRRGILESYLRRLVAGVIGIEEDCISADASFLEMGLNSLHAAELIEQVAKDFGVAAAPATVFDNPTILSLARFLSEEFERNRCAKDDTAKESMVEGSL